MAWYRGTVVPFEACTRNSMGIAVEVPHRSSPSKLPVTGLRDQSRSMRILQSSNIRGCDTDEARVLAPRPYHMQRDTRHVA